MIVEWLKVKVNPALPSQCRPTDREIWTAFPARRSGFVSPPIGLSPVTPDDRVIARSTGSAWQQSPAALLEATAALVTTALGQTLPQVKTGEHPVSED
jgi:hypothetical protein